MTRRGSSAVLVGALAAVALSGSAAGARPASSTAIAAAAPFAQAWAAVPKTTAARKAANRVVFGMAGDVAGGFNGFLTCCNSVWTYFMGHTEALRKLRADERTAEIPVVALTSSTMKGDRERFLAAGFDGYLQKPISVREFADQVRSHLGAAT